MSEMKYAVKENNEWKISDAPVEGAIPFKKVEIQVGAYQTELCCYAYESKESARDLDPDSIESASDFRCCDVPFDAEDSCIFWESSSMFIDGNDVSDADMEFDGYDEPEDYCDDDHEVVIKTNEASKVNMSPVNIFIPDIEYEYDNLCFSQPDSYETLYINSEVFDESEELKNLWADYSYEELMKIMELINEKNTIEPPEDDCVSEYHVCLEMDYSMPKSEEITYCLKNDDDEWDEYDSLEDLLDSIG